MLERMGFQVSPWSRSVRRRSPCPARVPSRRVARRVNAQVAENVAIRRRLQSACNRIRDAAQGLYSPPCARFDALRRDSPPPYPARVWRRALRRPARSRRAARGRSPASAASGKEKCGGRERRNIPPRTGNEPVAGVASETVMFVGTHLSQQTPPEECVTGVREGDAKLCRRVPSRFGFRRTTFRSRNASRAKIHFFPFFQTVCRS